VSDSERATLPGDLEYPASALETPEPHSGVVALDAVPWLLVTHDQLVAMPLDPRRAFLISRVDGRCTVEMIADISGFERSEVTAMMMELVGLGVLELRGGSR
jgi:hypothetical protein